MLRDKEELESAFEALQEETEQNRLSEEGGDKEIKTLKKIVKNLEVIIKLLVSLRIPLFHSKIS